MGLNFATRINKSQGKAFKFFGIHLRTPLLVAQEQATHKK
jgi:hypothetical protein